MPYDLPNLNEPKPSFWGRYKKGILAFLVVVLALSAAGIGYWIVSHPEKRTTVKMISGCQPAYSGANGHGSAILACSPSYNPEEGAPSESEIRPFFDTVTYELTSGTDGELKNGETITFKAVYDQQLADQLHLQIEDTSSTYQVNGLPDSYTKWSDFSLQEREAIDDLCARALVNYFTDLYGSKVKIDQAILVGKYLNEIDRAGQPAATLDYIVKVVYTREVWGFFKSRQESTSAYYDITVPGLRPDQPMDTTLGNSGVTVSPISTQFANDSEVKDWFFSINPNSVDIYS